MAGQFETWLAGGKAAAKPQVSADPAPERRPGERYDLPATGVGAVAGLGRRLLGFVVDCVVAALITSPFVHAHLTSPSATQSAPSPVGHLAETGSRISSRACRRSGGA